MRRLIALSLTALAMVGTGALLLSSASARPTSARAPAPRFTVPKALQPQLQALERSMARRSHTAPKTRSLNVQPSSGYACPIATGSPCGRTPCVVYPRAPSAVAVPLRTAPCAKALARRLPAIAR